MRSGTYTESPVSRVPNELLSDIFNKCCHTLASVFLSHVCRRWRHVATNNPRLWAHITLHIDTHTREGIMKLLTLFLERSATQPLSVELELCTSSKPELLPVLLTHEALVILLAHAQRWTSVCLWFEFAHFDALCTRLQPITQRKAFPILRSANIIVTGRRNRPAYVLPLKSSTHMFLEHAPALREFTWSIDSDRKDHTFFADVQFILPRAKPTGNEAWSGLKTVSLYGNYEPTVIFTFLKTARQLEYFKICAVLVHSLMHQMLVTVDMPSEVRTVMPALRTLEVFGTYYSLGWLLTRLVCPALISLTVNTGMDKRADRLNILHTSLVMFLQHCEQVAEKSQSCVNEGGPDSSLTSEGTAKNDLMGLQELFFEGTGLSHEQVSACVGHAKNLRRLKVDGVTERWED